MSYPKLFISVLILFFVFISCDDECETNDINNQEQIYSFRIYNTDFIINENSSTTITAILNDSNNVLSSHEVVWEINSNYVQFSNINNLNIIFNSLEVQNDVDVNVKAYPKFDPDNFDMINVRIINIVEKDTNICFERDILPIFTSNCTMSGCHIGSNPPDDLWLDNYNSIMKEIKPFDAEDSEIFEVIVSNKQDKVMPPPPYSKLSNEQIELIRRWINEGAKNEDCPEVDCDLNNVTYVDHVSKIITSNCLPCHNTNIMSGNLNLSSSELVKFSIENRNLINSIQHTNGFKNMPPSSKLSQCDIDRIIKWSEEGFK